MGTGNGASFGWDLAPFLRRGKRKPVSAILIIDRRRVKLKLSTSCMHIFKSISADALQIQKFKNGGKLNGLTYAASLSILSL